MARPETIKITRHYLEDQLALKITTCMVFVLLHDVTIFYFAVTLDSN